MGNFINKQSNIGNNTHIFNKVYTTKLNDGENEVSIADLTSDSTKPTDINDYIVESYRDGYSWYEIYKSGKIRQGGSEIAIRDKIVNFLKPFANDRYLVIIGYYDYFSPDDMAYATVQWRDKTTTTVRFQCAWPGEGKGYYPTTVDWIAEGQGA